MNFKLPSEARLIYQASVAIFPLCLAVIPWGILCGSLAIQAGLSPIQAQAMSLFVFAGAAQLAGISLFGVMSPTLPILSSTFVIGSRHLLYSAVFQTDIMKLSWFKRMAFAFFLTDEMFAVSTSHIDKTRSFSYVYAMTAGVGFYLVWNLATLGGIIAGSSIDNIEELGLEFAIAATFIAIVIPSIKDRSTLFAVLVSGFSVLAFDMVGFEYSLIGATILGMITGFYTSNGEKMTLNTEWVIFLMALITFSCRYLFFMKSMPISLGSKTKQLLRYTAPSVLTAMWVPIVFLGHGYSLDTLHTSPFFYAGAITVLLSLKYKNTLLIVAGGMVVFSVLNWLFASL